jgi:RHS repeat-associated protein
VPFAQREVVDGEAGPFEQLLTGPTGLPVAVVRGDGQAVRALEGDLYGQMPAGPTGPAGATAARFVGQWYDEETGLHFNRHRYYDPETGCYLSPEPLGLEGSLKAYAYTDVYTVDAVDVDGRKKKRMISVVRLKDGTTLDNLLEAAFTTKSIASSLVEALMEECQLKPDDEIKMPEPRRPITLAEVKTKYAPLFDRWVEKFGHWYALNAIRGEMHSLGWFADRLCQTQGYKVVVFGHTHEALTDLDASWRDDRIDVNSGSFCVDRPTFAEVNQRDGCFAVRIWQGSAEAKGFTVVKEASVRG